MALKPGYNIAKNKFDAEKFVLASKESALSSYFSAVKISNRSLLGNGEEVEEYISNSIAVAKQYLEEIASGKFPATPKQQTCDFCHYHAICRINERLS